jgi:hypothetical protein
MALKIRNEGSDRFFYILFCIFSLGFSWWMRVIISEAIRQALTNSNETDK